MVSFMDFLAPAERQAFTAVADERTFPQGAVIMREGDQSNHVMVIMDGWTRISVKDGGGERTLAERGPGLLVGERGARRLHARSATVTALGTVRVLVMKSGDFASFVSAHPAVSEFVENLIASYPAVEAADEEPGHRDPALAEPVVQQRPSATSRPPQLTGENCSVLLTDVVAFSGAHRNAEDRRIVRLRAEEIMRTSLDPLWDKCIVEDRGDGKLIVVPPAIPTARVIACLHRELPAELRKHNHTYGPPTRIRLRIAINVGPVTSDDFGLEGDAINRTARLIEAPAIKDTMNSTGAILGIIASTFVYDTAIRDAGESAVAGKYKMVRVKVKQYQDSAWLRLFDSVPPRRTMRRASRPQNPGGPLQDAAR